MPENERLADELAQITREINSPDSLDGTVQSIVEAAVQSIDGIDHVGISISHRDGRIETLASTDPLVLEFDRLQYDLHEGPCVFAMEQKPVVVVEHARTVEHQQWPRYMPQAVGLGLRSQLAVQLYLEEDTLGGLNMYSTSSDTLDPEAVHTAELFAAHAAVALGKSRQLSQMGEALATRGLIGQAIGITMHRHRMDADTAFRFLTRTSSHRNIKLRLVAQQIVDDVAAESGSAPDN